MIRRNRQYNFWAPIVGAFVFCAVACTPSREYRQRVIVQVNDRKMTAEEFSEALAKHLKAFNALTAKDAAIVSHAKNTVVENFIVRVLIDQWASQNQVFVRKEDLDAEIRKIRSSYSDDISFRKALSNEGLTYEEWESQVKQTLLEKLVVQQLTKNVKEPTDQEIAEYYEANKSKFQTPGQIKIRQIVTSNEENAKKIMQELRRGRPMAELAQKFSITPEAENGGLVGWVERGTLEVFDTTLRLGVGQRSQIIKSPYGYHIMEVVAKRQPKTLTLKEVEKQIRRTILEDREQAFFAKWLEEQVLKARVYKDEEYLKRIQVQTRGEGV